MENTGDSTLSKLTESQKSLQDTREEQMPDWEKISDDILCTAHERLEELRSDLSPKVETLTDQLIIVEKRMASLEATNTTFQKQEEERVFQLKEKLTRVEQRVIKATGLLDTQVLDRKKKLGDQERLVKELAQQVQTEKLLKLKLEKELKTEQDMRETLSKEVQDLKASFQLLLTQQANLQQHLTAQVENKLKTEEGLRQNLRQEVQSLMLSFKPFQSQISLLQHDVSSCKKQVEAKSQKDTLLLNDITKTVATHEAELASLKDTLVKVETDVVASKSKKQDLETGIECLKDRSNCLENLINSEKTLRMEEIKELKILNNDLTDKVNEIEERLDDFQVQLLSNDASRNANETPGTTDVTITEADINTSNAEAVDDRDGNSLCPLLQSQVANPDLSQTSVKDSVLPIPLPSSEQSKEIGTSNNSIPPRKRKRSDSNTNLYTNGKTFPQDRTALLPSSSSEAESTTTSTPPNPASHSHLQPETQLDLQWIINRIYDWRRKMGKDHGIKPAHILAWGEITPIAQQIKKEGEVKQASLAKLLHGKFSLGEKTQLTPKTMAMAAHLLRIFVNKDQTAYEKLVSTICHNCNGRGHPARLCRKPSKEGSQRGRAPWQSNMRTAAGSDDGIPFAETQNFGYPGQQEMDYSQYDVCQDYYYDGYYQQ